MKKTLILLLILLPLALLGQDLECCKSKKDVEKYLSGNWKKKDSDLKEFYQYKFDDTKGESKIFKINDDGTLSVIKNSESLIKISKTSKGYRIEHDRGKITTYSGIKYLDSIKLIVTRRDGKESILHKVLE